MLVSIYIMICSACIFTANSLTIKNSLITFTCVGTFIAGEIIYLLQPYKLTMN